MHQHNTGMEPKNPFEDLTSPRQWVCLEKRSQYCFFWTISGESAWSKWNKSLQYCAPCNIMRIDGIFWLVNGCWKVKEEQTSYVRVTDWLVRIIDKALNPREVERNWVHVSLTIVIRLHWSIRLDTWMHEKVENRVCNMCVYVFAQVNVRAWELAWQNQGMACFISFQSEPVSPHTHTHTQWKKLEI